jgi:hypothetical protein
MQRVGGLWRWYPQDDFVVNLGLLVKAVEAVTSELLCEMQWNGHGETGVCLELVTFRAKMLGLFNDQYIVQMHVSVHTYQTLVICLGPLDHGNPIE